MGPLAGSPKLHNQLFNVPALGTDWSLKDITPFAQMAPEGPAKLKSDVGNGFTVIVNVVGVAHWPGVGVNVYVVVAVLFKAGAQVPVIPLLDVEGRGNNGIPEHISGIGVNPGTTIGFTVMINVVVTAHWPAAGVNV